MNQSTDRPSRVYLRGIAHPTQRAFLEAYVEVVIQGSNSPIADACAKIGIWRGTPARWRERGPFASAAAKASRMAWDIRCDEIRKQFRIEDPDRYARVYGHLDAAHTRPQAATVLQQINMAMRRNV